MITKRIFKHAPSHFLNILDVDLDLRVNLSIFCIIHVWIYHDKGLSLRLIQKKY